MKVIKIIGSASGKPTPVDGSYLKECDVDARDGLGTVKGTTEIGKAMKFESTADAFAYWKRTSNVLPTRVGYDNKPNRPLTAYTIEIKDA